MNLNVVCAGCAVMAAIAAAGDVGAASDLASRQRSGYEGFFIGKNNQGLRGSPDVINRAIDKLGEYGFNAIDVKVQCYEQTRGEPMDVAADRDVLKAMVDRAHAKGLKFNVYLYPIPYNPGRLAENIDDVATWKNLFGHAFQFVRLRKKIGFDSLRFDIETISLFKSWDAEGRAKIEAAVAQFVREFHEIEPDLSLGYMPADHHPLSDIFDRQLATPQAPAYLDAWDLYNGNGYSESIRKRAEAAKQANPNNRFIVWMRPNSYRLDDVAPTIYHTVKNTDGYSIWCLYMMDDALVKTDPTYMLPRPWTGEQYYAAFGEANAALKNGTEIPYKEVKAIVPELKLDDVKRIDLKKDRFTAKKSSRALVLRDFQTIFVAARQGDTITATMAQRAGQRRPVALHYAVLAPDGSELRHESISPGASETWSVVAPEKGVYTIAATAGSDGQAWWSVSVRDLPWCVDARSGTYLFGPQTIRIPGKTCGNPVLHMRNWPDQAYSFRVGSGEWSDVVRPTETTQVFELEEEMTTISFRKIEDVAYAQDFMLSFPGGMLPFVFAE